MHGPDPDVLYAGSYSDDDLRWWRDRIREWQEQGRDVLVYFNNDGEGTRCATPCACGNSCPADAGRLVRCDQPSRSSPPIG